MPTLNVNGKSVTVDVPAETPILWTLRDELGLAGAAVMASSSVCNAIFAATGKRIRRLPIGAQLKT